MLYKNLKDKYIMKKRLAGRYLFKIDKVITSQFCGLGEGQKFENFESFAIV